MYQEEWVQIIICITSVTTSALVPNKGKGFQILFIFMNIQK